MARNNEYWVINKIKNVIRNITELVNNCSWAALTRLFVLGSPWGLKREGRRGGLVYLNSFRLYTSIYCIYTRVIILNMF